MTARKERKKEGRKRRKERWKVCTRKNIYPQETEAKCRQIKLISSRNGKENEIRIKK